MTRRCGSRYASAGTGRNKEKGGLELLADDDVRSRRAPNHFGVHLIVDAWEAVPERLDDPARVEAAMREAVAASGATLIDLSVHKFAPHGVTATATLAESHIAVHTWPEHGYFAMDLFFCGGADLGVAMQTVIEHLGADRVRTRIIERGLLNAEEAAVPAPVVG